MRPPGTPEQLEARRRRAIELLVSGESLSSVARAVDASVSSVHRWYQAYQAEGLKGLSPRPTPGRPPKLARAQLAQLPRLVVQGAEAYGFPTPVWTPSAWPT